MSPALEDRFLMTGPPKEDPVAHFNVVRLMQICVLGLVIFSLPVTTSDVSVFGVRVYVP